MLEKIHLCIPVSDEKMRFFFLEFLFEIWVITNEGTSGFPRQGTYPTETYGKSCTPKVPNSRVGNVGNPREAKPGFLFKPSGGGGYLLVPDYWFWVLLLVGI